ncbi:MAG: UbiA family prenyltransferase, partial [Bacteroidota bacterium]
MSGFIQKSTLLHLRLPFSVLLMPVFCFAVGLSDGYSYFKLALIFFILHILVYPASNAYNSYFDKDEDSIGGLENPPPVSRELLHVSLAMDALALFLALGVSWYFAFGVLIYGL